MDGFFAALFFFTLSALFVCFAVRSARCNSHKSKPEYKASVDAKIVQMIFEDFARIGWSSWDISVHRADGQYERMKRAVGPNSMVVVSVDQAAGKAIVLGESGKEYTVSSAGCSCPDFQARGLPCKHMYFVAMEK